MVVEPGQDLTTTFPTSHTGHQGVPSSGGGGGEAASTQEPSSGGGVPLGGGEHHSGQHTPSHHHQYSTSNAQNPLYMTRKSFHHDRLLAGFLSFSIVSNHRTQ